MNSDGSLYVTEELKKQLDERYKKLEGIFTATPPADALLLEDPFVMQELAQMNRACRRVFFSERRRGASETDALESARLALPEK